MSYINQMSGFEIFLGSLIIFFVGLLINRVVYYRKLWLTEKNRVSWTMPSANPNKWAVQKSYWYMPDNKSTFAVIDFTNKAQVADGFTSQAEAQEYIDAEIQRTGTGGSAW